MNRFFKFVFNLCTVISACLLLGIIGLCFWGHHFGSHVQHVTRVKAIESLVVNDRLAFGFDAHGIGYQDNNDAYFYVVPATTEQNYSHFDPAAGPYATSMAAKLDAENKPAELETYYLRIDPRGHDHKIEKAGTTPTGTYDLLSSTRSVTIPFIYLIVLTAIIPFLRIVSLLAVATGKPIN